MAACAFCGRKNAADSRFCIDCGKPLPSDTAAGPPAPPAPRHTPVGIRRSSGGIARRTSGAQHAMAIVPPTRAQAPGASTVCGWCGSTIESGLPFCPFCGRRTDAKLATAGACLRCGSVVRAGVDAFCAACGASLAPPPMTAETPEVRTLVFSAKRGDRTPRLALLDEDGEPKRVIALEGPELTIGRGSCAISIPDDPFLSPAHAQFVMRDGELWIRDLGSSNRTWVFLDAPHPLADEDVMLVGSQLLQFRRLAAASPAASDVAGTRPMISLTPPMDVAVLIQLRGDGAARDTRHLSPGQAVDIGRTAGDWTFPYDQTMSSRHARIADESGRFIVTDLNSRNGVAVAVRGERPLNPGQRVLAGDQVLRVESA